MANETTYKDEPRKRRVHPLNWIGWVLAVLFLGAAAWLAHHAAWVRRQSDAVRGHAAQLQLQLDHANGLVSVLTSPDSKHVMLTENRHPPHPSGEISWLPGKGALVFMAGGLHPLPRGRTYELWLVPANGNAPIPAGLFQPNKDQSATVVLPPIPADTQAKRFLVTEEPEAGSATPSLPIVLQWEAAR